MSQNVVTTERPLKKTIGLAFALLVFIVIGFLLPQPEGLPVAGQRMLALLVFSVICWITEAVEYPVSALVILALMVIVIGISPDVNKPASVYGMGQGISMGLRGFSSSGWALVAAALFLAVAMQKTGFDRRLALLILSFVGAKSKNIVIGVILVGFVLAFFVPSTTARVACIVPIIMGIISVFGVDKRGAFASTLMIVCAQADSIWNVGIKTAAAQNMITVNFIKQILGRDILWIDWFIAAAPFAALMSVGLYLVMMFIMPPEVEEIPGGRGMIKKQLAELGPMNPAERKLMIISILLLIFWVLEGVRFSSFGITGSLANTRIHPFDTASITIVAVTLFFMPKIDILEWKYCVTKINWGTIVLFGVGISLGSAILATQAGQWLAKYLVASLALASQTPFVILAILALFLIIIHLGFASATALASALIPIIIAVLQEVAKVQGDAVNILGLTMILQYVVSFGFILPVNAPQNMIAYGTETFTAGTFIRTGIPLMILAYALLLLMASTYWKFLGYV
ncbi:MAG: anion permease [Desulfovibrio sp.]|nr:anion permease [Desulfovibrio sp.]